MGFLRDQEVPKQKRSSTFLRKAEFGLSKILGASDGEKDVIEQRYSVAASYQPSHAYPKTKFSFKKKGMSPCEDTGLPDYILLEPMNFLSDTPSTVPYSASWLWIPTSQSLMPTLKSHRSGPCTY